MLSIKRATTEVDTMRHWSVLIGTSRMPITNTPTHFRFGMWLIAREGDLGLIYVGNEDVDLPNQPGPCGYQLMPLAHNKLWLPIGDASHVYAIADTPNQKLFVLGC